MEKRSPSSICMKEAFEKTNPNHLTNRIFEFSGNWRFCVQPPQMRPVQPHCGVHWRTLFDSSYLEIRHQAQLSLQKSPSSFSQENIAQSNLHFWVQREVSHDALLFFRTSFTRFSKKMWYRKTFTSKGTDSRKGRTLGISSIRKSNMCGTRIKAWVMFSFSHYACIYGIFVVRFQNYRKLRNLDEHMLASDFHKRNKGLTDNKVQDRVQEFGANFIKISVPPILYLLFHEVQFPFSFITFDWRKLFFYRRWILFICFKRIPWSSGLSRCTGSLLSS